MSDCIDRQQTIYAIFDAVNSFYGEPNVDRGIILEEIVREVKKLPSENKGEWILVSERLPEDGEKVLCSVADSNHSVVINCFENQSYWRDGKIYAWQPLPEPYKAESEEV